MVGAERPIFFGPAAEFTERHHDDAIRQLDRAQVVEERTDRAGKLAQEPE